MSAAHLYTDLNCATCTARQKEVRGCEKAARVKWWTDVTGQARDRCPRRPIFEDIVWYNRLISAFNAYKAGFLPHRGGMEDQAALFPETMALIDGTIDKCDQVKQQRGNTPPGTMRIGMM